MLEGMFNFAQPTTNLLELDAWYQDLKIDGRLSHPFDKGNVGPGSDELRPMTGPYGTDNVYRITTPVGSDFQYVGGWETKPIEVDINSKYRFSVWVKFGPEVIDNSNSFYLGTNRNGPASENVINVATGTIDINPYFCNFGTNQPVPVDTWMLAVGYIRAKGDTTTEKLSKVYLQNGTVLPIACKDFKFHPNNTRLIHRVYSYYGNVPGVSKIFYHPRIDKCDGREPNVNQLLTSKQL